MRSYPTPVPIPVTPRPSPLPAGSQVMRAGVSGAAITGAWTAINESIRVRNNEITTEDAIRATANSAAIGAGAGAVASIASHVARSVPLLGLAVIAAGVGAYYFANAPKKPETQAAEPGETSAS